MSIQKDVALNGLYSFEQLMNDHNQIGYKALNKFSRCMNTSTYLRFQL